MTQKDATESFYQSLKGLGIVCVRSIWDFDKVLL